MQRLLVALAVLLAGCTSHGHGSTSMLVTSSPPSLQLAIASGDAQSASTGSPLASPLVVRVTDGANRPASGVVVSFAVAAGGGTLSAASATTDALGLAQTLLTLGAGPGVDTVTATLATGGSVTFTETSVGTTVAAGPASVDFGNVVVGMSVMQTVVLTNTTVANVTVTQLVPSGAGLSVGGPALPLALAPGQSANVTLIFAPSSYGPSSGGLSVTSTAFTATTLVPVKGAGVKTHSVTLSWNPSTSANVVGYNAYRGTTPGGPYARLNASPIPGTSYDDTTVSSGTTYYYVATALDSNNLESVDSNEAQAVVPFP